MLVRLLVSWHLAEGSPCYAHDDEGSGIEDIGSQFATWWDFAIRAITPQTDNEDENSETEGGLITIKKPKSKGDKEPELDPNTEQIIDSETNPTTETSETTEEDAAIPDK